MRVFWLGPLSAFVLLVCAGCGGAKPGNGIVTNNLKPKTIDAKKAPFVAEKKSKIYHARNCKYAASLESAIGFATESDAQWSGRLPCRFCCKHDYPEPEEHKNSGLNPDTTQAPLSELEPAK